MDILEKCVRAFELAMEDIQPPQVDCPPEMIVEIARMFFISGVTSALREVEYEKRSI